MPENYCHLCRVSLATGRIRTVDEPEEYAWDHTGGYFSWDDDDILPGEDPCESRVETGCTTKQREGTYYEREHLAGPGCRFTTGYAGSRISLAEMMGCRSSRLIVTKTDAMHEAWDDEDDDEPWERTTKYFFTGVGDGSPEEEPMEDFDRIRHDVNSVYMSNERNTDETSGLPVHPTCWDLFKRISKMRCGFVDVHGLMCFANLVGSKRARDVLRHPAVTAAWKDAWEHNPGSEWLIANPVDVPGFAGLVKSKGDSLRRKSPAKDSIFDESLGITIETTMSLRLQHDPMGILPTKVRWTMLQSLPTRDIAAARLVFRSLKVLPQSFFRQRVFDDMPWLWEARSLDHAKVDWYNIYCDAKFVWSGLKGFKNRARIWKETDEIVRRIQQLRLDGSIKGITGWEEDAT